MNELLKLECGVCHRRALVNGHPDVKDRGWRRVLVGDGETWECWTCFATDVQKGQIEMVVEDTTEREQALAEAYDLETEERILDRVVKGEFCEQDRDILLAAIAILAAESRERREKFHISSPVWELTTYLARPEVYEAM